MTLDPNLLDQAYHLFVEEALELLQQVQELLIALPHDRSLTAIHKLLRTAGTIRSGAAQVNLTEIDRLARRFEWVCRLLWQEKTVVDTELGNLLWQAYDCLRLSLSAQMRRDREETTNLLAQAEEVFSQLEARLLGQSKNESDLLTLNRIEENGIQLLFDQEVTQALIGLESLLSESQIPDFQEALKAQIELWLGLGEVWDIPAFTAIAQMSLAALQISPQIAPTIGQLALTGFRGACQTLDRNSLEAEALVLTPHRQTQPKSLSPALVEEKERSPVKSPMAGLLPPFNSPTVLKTAKLFIWLTGSTTFIVSSECIQEIVLPSTDLLNSGVREQWLRWRGQQIPLYNLSELLQYNCPLGDGYEPKNPVLLVLTSAKQTLALEVDIERSIAEPELTILPFNSVLKPPEYCYGCILFDGDRLGVAIDLEILLTQTLTQMSKTAKQTANFSLTAFAPTILVIDDSNTSRQLLVLTLQKEGYRVLQARDGEEGIRQMRQNPAIDLVISDIEMPNLNGFGFLQFCHNDSQLSKVPIMLLSSFGSPQHRKIAMDLGAVACLSKPFDDREFISILNNFLLKKTG